MKKALITSLLFFYIVVSAISNVSLPHIICDHMVLQRGAEITIWGWADEKEKIKVEFNGQEKSIIAKDGNWKVKFPAMKAGGPFQMTISGNNNIELKDILIGDVWICSGQSNMEWPFSKTDRFDKDWPVAYNQKIRLFDVPRNTSSIPLEQIYETGWSICDTASVKHFSAVGYYFGKYLQEQLDVPIGLISTNWGGTNVQTWTSSKAINAVADQISFPVFTKPLFNMKAKSKEEMEDKYSAFMKEFGPTKGGLVDGKAIWADPDLDESTWKEMQLPMLWENAGLLGLDGVVWYRKTFELTKDQLGKELLLSLGPIDDGDITWVNGEKVGETKDAYDFRRKYTIPEAYLREGKNVIAIRVVDFMGGGGIYGVPGELYVKNEKVDIQLAGTWKFRISPVDFLLVETGASPNSSPSLLFNAMIHPILNYPVKGAIWYQGESNAGKAYDYRTLFPLMINDWRKYWNQPEMPFLFVQLANFKSKREEPVESEWAELREAQLMTLSLPKTGMAVTIDIGEADDIHPRNKKEVGRRLSLYARKEGYNEDIVYSGPLYESMEVVDNKVVVSFSNIGSGLITKNKYGYLRGFALAGKNKKWYWAKAKIEGDKVLVWSERVPEPVSVRYGWSDNPDADLFNQEGLPASPFRTDDWKRSTQPEN